MIFKPIQLQPASLFVPLFPMRVHAGFPSPAADYMEERIDLNKWLVDHPDNTFVIACEDDSMINAFIPKSAQLLIDRSLTTKSGDIVLAAVDGNFTVKRFRKEGNRCWLQPENNHYKNILITEDMNLVIWGVVTGIVINTKGGSDVRTC